MIKSAINIFFLLTSWIISCLIILAFIMFSSTSSLWLCNITDSCSWFISTSAIDSTNILGQMGSYSPPSPMHPSRLKCSSSYIWNNGFNDLYLQLEYEISNFRSVRLDYPSANTRAGRTLLLNAPFRDNDEVKDEVKEDKFEKESIRDLFWF